MGLRRNAAVAWGLALFSGVAGEVASADVIFNDFGPSYSYDCCTGWAVFGASSSIGPLVPAMFFTSPQNDNVTQIDLALGYLQGTNSAVVSLWTDVANTPSTELGSWPVSGQPSFGISSSTPITTISGITGISLDAGGSYFLEVSPGNSDTLDAWNLNTSGYTTLIALNGAPFTSAATSAAFDIIGDPVPEPASLALIAGSVSGVFWFWRRRRKLHA